MDMGAPNQPEAPLTDAVVSFVRGGFQGPVLGVIVLLVTLVLLRASMGTSGLLFIRHLILLF